MRGRRVVREAREVEGASIDLVADEERWGWWHHVERVWLGLARPALAMRLHAAGWAPDSPQDYCGRCGETVGPGEAGPEGCSACAGERLPWSRMVRLGAFEGELREAVHELKFSRGRPAGRVLGRLLGRSLREAIVNAGVEVHAVRVVPMPTTFRRPMVRGIDHALVLARAAAGEVGCPVARVLTRKHGRPQAGKSRAERESLIRGVFGWTAVESHASEGARPAVWVVVDDVRTTGATMRGACGALRRALGGLGGGEVWGAVVGVTPGEGRRVEG